MWLFYPLVNELLILFTWSPLQKTPLFLNFRIFGEVCFYRALLWLELALTVVQWQFILCGFVAIVQWARQHNFNCTFIRVYLTARFVTTTTTIIIIIATPIPYNIIPDVEPQPLSCISMSFQQRSHIRRFMDSFQTWSIVSFGLDMRYFVG